MRARLDLIHPHVTRPAFTKLFSLLQRGKILESFCFMDKYYLISLDGTGYFSSPTIHCNNCCTKEHKDGHITYGSVASVRQGYKMEANGRTPDTLRH